MMGDRELQALNHILNEMDTERDELIEFLDRERAAIRIARLQILEANNRNPLQMIGE